MGAPAPEGLLDLLLLTLCLLLASRGCSHLLAATKYRIAGQFFSGCWLWYVGISAFLPECFPACLGSVCCAVLLGHPAVLIATHKPGFSLRCLLICCFLPAASFPSLLLPPTSPPLTASYGNGKLLSLWQVHRFYIQEQLFKLFPLIKRFKFWKWKNIYFSWFSKLRGMYVFKYWWLSPLVFPILKQLKKWCGISNHNRESLNKL